MNSVDQGLLSPSDLTERLRWARTRGHPLYIWPEVPTVEWRAALLQIERVTRNLLGGQQRDVLEGGDADFCRALTVAAFTSGMGPLLGWWLEQGMLEAEPQTRRLLSEHLAQGRRRWQRMHQALRDAVTVLNASDIPVTVLKGAHTACTCFPEPGVRPMSDLDLLVDATHVERAERALAAAGYRYVSGTRLARPYRSDWRPAGAPERVHSVALHHSENPFALDLHAATEVSFFGVRSIHFEPGSMITRPAAAWAGNPAFILPQPVAFAHYAAHASRGLYNLTLIRLVELAFMIRTEAGTSLQWSELTELLQRERAQRFVYPAFALLDRLVPGIIDAELRNMLERTATRAQRAVLAELSPATAQGTDRIALREQFMWAASPADFLRRAAYMVLPLADSGSMAKLALIYVQRIFRVLRGRVRLRPVRRRT